MSDAARHTTPDPEPRPSRIAPLPDDVRLSTQREHAFRSLLQMGGEISLSIGLHEAVDLMLFNLMGQFRTPRSALWLLAEGERAVPVLIRAHGFPRETAELAGHTLANLLVELFAQRNEPVAGEWLRAAVGKEECERMGFCGFGVVAPVRARGELIGWLALGGKLDGTKYSAEELQIIQSSLGFAGVLIHNASMHNRVLEANRQLQATNDRLQELDRLKTDFLSNVNHEIRTPLAIVIGMLECLEPMVAERDEAREMIRAALVSSDKLKKLIENLLTFSEVNASRLSYEVAAHDVRELLEAYHRARLPGVTADLRQLALDATAVLPLGRCDPQRLQQILDELVDNAVKFTPRGSEIRLVLRPESSDGASWVRIDVSDDGPGIPEDTVDLLFGSFFQGDGSSTRAVGGLGMGLAFARQLAEHMGCRLSVTATSARGTTFTLLVPAA